MSGVPLASKYGALDNLRSSIGIIYAKQGRIAIAITVDEMPEVIWSVDNAGYLLMSRISELLVTELKALPQKSQMLCHSGIEPKKSLLLTVEAKPSRQDVLAISAFNLPK
jgi:hypothetical protein